MRVNFNYFLSEQVFRYIVEAVTLVADHGEALLTDYRFDLTSGLWRHRADPPEPPLRLADVSYDSDGRIVYPHTHETAPESALAGHLDEARVLLEERDSAAVVNRRDVAVLSTNLEALRWFELPVACLAD